MSILIDHDLCNGCGICADLCPEDVFVMGEASPDAARESECWYCGACMMDCPVDAIEVVFPPYMRPVVLKGAPT